MNLLLVIVISLAVAALLLWPRRSGVLPRAALTGGLALCAAGSASYWISGKPGLPARPVQQAAVALPDGRQAAEARAVLLKDPTNISAWLRLADGLQKSGKSDEALEGLTVALRAMPQSADLWVMRGQILVQRSGGTLSPAARFAFDRAAEIDPKHPAPRYMLALAWVMQGKPQEAKPVLEALLKDTPAGVPYRAAIERLLRGVNAMIAAGVGAEPSPE